MDRISIRPIGKIHTAFPEKFGIPRQSGLVETEARIVLEEPFNDVNAIRGLEEYSHIWIIWQVSEALEMTSEWMPMVRPPRLGGNKKVGVFATRSPFHPNALGLSCVRLLGVEQTSNGMEIRVSGADILDGTPIYDIKPYIKVSDCREDAICGFTENIEDDSLKIEFSSDFERPEDLADEDLEKITELIACDPRPRYIKDEEREYGMRYRNWNVRFKVEDGVAILIKAEDYT